MKKKYTYKCTNKITNTITDENGKIISKKEEIIVILERNKSKVEFKKL